MFHVFDNILIFGIFVFAVVMAIRVSCANMPRAEKKPDMKPKTALEATSPEDKDPPT